MMLAKDIKYIEITPIGLFIELVGSNDNNIRIDSPSVNIEFFTAPVNPNDDEKEQELELWFRIV